MKPVFLAAVINSIRTVASSSVDSRLSLKYRAFVNAQKEERHPKLRGGSGSGRASCFGRATFGVGIT
ncbi:hypothetical protein PUN28_010422 [Cardiocondyla obscurior]|uniref:Secreted protein n=1 Tax=Cardiocondyla obscurior TaxID=286306 RepID=A0AAW2FR59_9HYME